MLARVLGVQVCVCVSTWRVRVCVCACMRVLVYARVCVVYTGSLDARFKELPSCQSLCTSYQAGMRHITVFISMLKRSLLRFAQAGAAIISVDVPVCVCVCVCVCGCVSA